MPVNELEQCQALLVEHHPEYHLAALFSPIDKRRHATGLLTAIAEIRAIPRDCHETAVAATKLSWWQQECERLSNGVPRHPATRCLADHPTLPTSPLWQDLLDAVAHDVRYDAYPGEAELDDLAQRLAHPVAGLLALLDEANTDSRLHSLLARTSWLSRIHLHADTGRVYLPLDRLNTAALQPETLRDAQPSPELRELMRAEALRLSAALDTLPAGSPTQSVLRALALSELRRLCRRHWRNWPHTRPGWRGLLAAWNAARKAGQPR